MRPVIDHLSSEFSEVLSIDNEQSIDEHMVKFKGRSGMKQYIKSKPIKWDFKFWFCCSSKSGYLLRKETKTRVQSRSCGRSSSPADERLGAIVLHYLF